MHFFKLCLHRRHSVWHGGLLVVVVFCVHYANMHTHAHIQECSGQMCWLAAMQQELFARMPNIPVGAITSIHLLFPRLIRFPASFCACIESVCAVLLMLSQMRMYLLLLSTWKQKILLENAFGTKKEKFAYEYMHARRTHTHTRTQKENKSNRSVSGQRSFRESRPDLWCF